MHAEPGQSYVSLSGYNTVTLAVEPRDPDVMQWLLARLALLYASDLASDLAPDLARDPLALRQSLRKLQALIIPPTVTIDADALSLAPLLKAVGCWSADAENIDFDACARAGGAVVRHSDATAPAEAEFMVGALLQRFRRLPVVSAEGPLVGRERGSATVGLIGMSPRPPNPCLGCGGSWRARGRLRLDPACQ